MSKFQLKYGLLALVVVAFVALIVGGGIYYSIRTTLQNQLPEISEQQLSLSLVFSDANRFLLSTLPVVLVLVLVLSWIVFRKITEPEYRLEKSLQALARGDFTVEVEYKPGEELATLVKLVNEVKEKLSRTMLEEKEITDRIFVIANEILRIAGKSDAKKSEIAELAEELLQPLEQLQIIIARHKVNALIK